MINFPLWVAKRYFLFGNKANFINVVALISIVVVAFVSLALVIALSVFNGLEDLIRSLYRSFDPEIKISVPEGKFFKLSAQEAKAIKEMPQIAFYTEVLEDYALARYKTEQTVVKVKGVSDDFYKENRLIDKMVEGKLLAYKGTAPFASIGQGVQYLLNLDLDGDLYAMQLLYPNAKYVGSVVSEKLINSLPIKVSGVFAIEKQYDDNYVIVPIQVAKELFMQENLISSIEIVPKHGFETKHIITELKKIVGHRLLVQDSDEQHKQLLSALKIEKLVMYLIVAFILLIASMNIFFCLSMLAVKKQKDITMLGVMGANSSVIRKIFLYEGMLIALVGNVLGIGLGVVVVLAQQYFGMISMGMESAIVDAYPVRLSIDDLFLVSFTVVFITMMASIHPAIKASKIVAVRDMI